MKPTRKVQNGGVAGALVVVLMFAFGLAGVPVPPEVAAALTTLIMFGASYLTHEG